MKFTPPRVFAFLLSAGLIVGCSYQGKEKSLNCRLAVEDGSPCTGVLSLVNAGLQLNQYEKTFEMEAHYKACYQDQDIKLTGTFQETTHPSITEFELTAQTYLSKTQENAPTPPTPRTPRTIGLVRLDPTTLKGGFVDVWATIRTHTSKTESLPEVAVDCQYGDTPQT